MAAKIDILTVGYSEPHELGSVKKEMEGQSSSKYIRATGSCCLVRSGGSNILFDTMGPWEKDSLLERLSKLRIHPEDIKYLVCSHSHPDHVGNINLFTKADKHFVGTSVYTSDVYDMNCFEPIGNYSYKTKRGIEVDMIRYRTVKLDSNLTLEPTQGHTLECISLIVGNCESYGTVALVGDLFERQEDVEDEGIWIGAGSQNIDFQRANRSNIYNKSDFILPGHGPIFKTKGRPVIF